MLNSQFLGQNLHFAIGLLASLSLFAVAWLYFDAWTNKKEKKSFLKWAGFFLLSISFLVYAVDVPWIGATDSETKTTIFRWASELIRIVGYLFVLVAEIMDPLQAVPTHKEEELIKEYKPEKSAPAIVVPGALTGIIKVLPVLGASSVAFMYWRRATKGLERHLKPLAYAFVSLAIFELLAQAYVLRGSDNVMVSQLTAVYGPVWFLENLLVLISGILLGRWVWKYLTKRFMSQLFMIFVGGIIAVFLATTLTFTFLLLKSIQNSTISSLTTTANVLGYALDSKRSETISSSEALSYNPEYAKAIVQKDHKRLAELSSNYLATKKQSSLIVTNDTGQVLLRGEDVDRWGDSLSSDPLIRRGLIGKSDSSISSVSGVLAPTLFIKSTSPVRDSNNTVIGTITTGVAIDDSFVDGIKRATGLDASIYSGNVRSATTTLAADGKSRWIGIKEQNNNVNETVIKKGETYSGAIDILNRPYLAVYRPLKDVDNVTVGMILIGQPQTELLKTANESIQKTFILAVVLLMISVVPAYFVSKYIAKQL